MYFQWLVLQKDQSLCFTLPQDQAITMQPSRPLLQNWWRGQCYIYACAQLGSCSCGVSKTQSGRTCAPSAVYATWCKCYVNSRPCTSLCCSKECTNPCGVRPHKQQGIKRQQHPHSMQQEIPSSKRFALARGQSLSTAVWSDFESIVITEICA